MNDGFVTLTLLSGRSLLEAVCRRLAVGCCCRAAVIIPTLHCSPFVHPSTIHHPPPLGCIQAPRHLSRYLVREQHNTNTQPRNPTRSSNNPRTRTFFPRAEGLFHQLRLHKNHECTYCSTYSRAITLANFSCARTYRYRACTVLTCEVGFARGEHEKSGERLTSDSTGSVGVNYNKGIVL